ETPGFEVEPATLHVVSAARFDDEQTSVTLDPSSEVQPGQRIAIRLHAVNCGTTATQSAKVTLGLPEGLLLVRGSGRLDGRPVRDRRKELGSYELGPIEAGAAVDFTAEATVISPQENAKALALRIALAWDGGERTFERTLNVNSQPYFDPRRTRIERVGSPAVRPGDPIEAAVILQNDGPAAATDCLLELHLDPAFEAIELAEKGEALALENNSADIERIDPYSGRRFSVRARVRTPYADGVPIELGATLHTLELGETSLSTASFRVDSHPRFTNEGSTIVAISDEILRPNQIADAYIKIVNEGTDTAHDVRLRLVISPELRLESVDGATRKKNCLLFGEIGAGRSAEARLSFRLLRTYARDDRVRLDAVLTAAGVLPVQLHSLQIATASEPDFSVGVLRSEPADLADVGETIQYVLHVHNGGDGVAQRVQINVEPSDALIYVPNSTAVNGVPVRDVGTASPLVSAEGIVLNEAQPGIEARVTWREVVHNGLPAGESIVRIAHVRYDNARHDEFSSGELKVRATAVFANNIPGLPFGLNGTLGPTMQAGPHALPDGGDGFVQLPPATPVAEQTYWLAAAQHSFEDGAVAAHEPQLRPNGSATTDAHALHHGDVASACIMPAERFEKTIRFLKEARFGALVSHLFAIRAFFPTTLSGADSLRAALEEERVQLRDALDRLFIKLRLPQYTLAARDLESMPMRRSLLELVKQLDGGRASAPAADADIVLSGVIDLGEAQQLSAAVRDAKLGTAPAWRMRAFFIPDGPPPLRGYRAALLEQFEGFESLSPDEFAQALTRPASAL
ncbi:MAG: hypothetical protein JOZ97_03185, partial [Candidatus Eremiobacteraeota bacterium]|nr:hypothetical protein [Candidatus Eremiobacteraeota bacterium]